MARSIWFGASLGAPPSDLVNASPAAAWAAYDPAMSRTAVLIRTHYADEQLRAFAATLRSERMFDVYALVDETRGAVDLGDIPKIAVSMEAAAELGLCVATPNLLWRCGDYGLYLARRALPGYDAFWMIEPDVRLWSAAPSSILSKFPPPDEADFLAAHLRPAEPDWNWGRTMDLADGPVWRCLFALVRLSGRALDAMLVERRRLSALAAEKGADPAFWPNDEVFTASTLVRKGFVCRDFNNFGRIYEPVGFSFWIPLSERELAASGQEGWIYHPVLSGQRYFLKLFRLASEQGNLDGLERLVDSLVGSEWTEEEAVGHRRALAFARSQLKIAGSP